MINHYQTRPNTNRSNQPHQKSYPSQTDQWLSWNSGPHTAAENMAIDEALLLSISTIGAPILRFYSWCENAASFGYFQEYSVVCQATKLRPLVRRPTGGGLVPHSNDWTYSLTIPPSHPWHSLKAQDSYEAMHTWIKNALSLLKINADLAPTKESGSSGHCFAGGAEKFDLLQNSKKIAGAAQKRNKLGLLIQGSIQPLPPNAETKSWINAMLRSAEAAHNISWSLFTPTTSFTTLAQCLTQEKYSQRAYNIRK
ncbi:MAG: hypothetical protein K9N48_02510 [Verrucomicrobia bacterium]|nr:hypothetical protein [Verrucomicrobiota bacterium]MCF7708940.1 hypothetical protein [Verrucomicrobiota bacterium]